MTAKLALRILAWALFGALIVVTIGPIGWRPVSRLPVQIERATALVIIGFVFGLAYPRHIILVALLVLGGTALLEALQVVEPSRHGRVADLLAKLAGGAIGLFCGWLISRTRDRSNQ